MRRVREDSSEYLEGVGNENLVIRGAGEAFNLREVGKANFDKLLNKKIRIVLNGEKGCGPLEKACKAALSPTYYKYGKIKGNPKDTQTRETT